MLIRSLLSACLLLQVCPGLAQKHPDDSDRQITKNFLQQLYFYPQEKVYLHFDRNHYIAGDTIWFRGYVINASSHVPDGSSRLFTGTPQYARMKTGPLRSNFTPPTRKKPVIRSSSKALHRTDKLSVR